MGNAARIFYKRLASLASTTASSTQGGSFPRPGLPLEDLVLRMHWMAERSKEKDNRVMSQARVME